MLVYNLMDLLNIKICLPINLLSLLQSIILTTASVRLLTAMCEEVYVVGTPAILIFTCMQKKCFNYILSLHNIIPRKLWGHWAKNYYVNDLSFTGLKPGDFN